MWKVRLLRTPLSVYTKNFRLVRLFLIRRGQIKVDQGDRPRISVRASLERSPRTSQKCRSQQLRMAGSTLQRIIRVDLHLFPYKIQLTQRLLSADKPRWLEWAQKSHRNGRRWRAISEQNYHVRLSPFHIEWDNWKSSGDSRSASSWRKSHSLVRR